MLHLPYLHLHRSNDARAPSCVSPSPANTLTDRLNTLLNSSGPGYTLSLCPSQQYLITAPLLFSAPNQEISTAGYPTDSTRATLVVHGPVVNGTGHTTAVDGTCTKCDGLKLRNVQINGTRLGGPPVLGGANIEMGGDNANQLIEYVHSFDPRGWSCLHVAQGTLQCTNATIQNNNIGPAGSDKFQQWADGISVACRNSLIRNNMINNPTDGAIVLFGAPGSHVENNTIWVETHTLLGGINMVDVQPFGGNYDDVVVTNNLIAGGFASQAPQGNETKGTNNNDVVIKIGIAIGPRTWFGDQYSNNVSTGGRVYGNQLTGAFSYGVAVTSATNFTVENNVLIGNTSFIGSRGPNCTNNNAIPSPAAFVIDFNNVKKSTTQIDFTSVSDGDGLTCVLPPDGGNYWPFGGSPNASSSSSSPSTTSSSHSSGGMTAGIVIGAIGAVLFVALITWLLRRWALKHSQAARVYPRHPHDSKGYVLQTSNQQLVSA
ncbi:hypothetical protein L210DRAFT_3547299 [Boletus edulis BED1]|uniref:Right handed beta helix domain-containing protein n=1 Tax=Boletus edulis BED1 TaxID=1328754 RepID=A0AAD4BQ83_BOLED|nr:hypothetical protein L210DRAFT_3547299 [Boletus edulis BED1]